MGHKYLGIGNFLHAKPIVCHFHVCQPLGIIIHGMSPHGHGMEGESPTHLENGVLL